MLLDFTGFLPSFTEYLWVLPDVTGFYRVLPSFFTGNYEIWLGFIKFFLWVLLDFTGFLPSFTEYLWVLLDVIEFYRVLSSFLRVIMRFDLVLSSFAWMLVDFTGFYLVLPSVYGLY